MSEKKLIDAGTHKVKVQSWGLRETNGGNIQVWIRFSNSSVMFQNVNSNDVGDEILARSLVLCGFTGKDLADLYKKDALDTNKTVEIYVQHKPSSETGELQMHVNVSDPARAGMKGDLEKADGLKMIKKLKLNLRADLKSALSDDNLKGSEAEDSSEDNPSNYSSDDDDDDDSIPF